MILDHIQEVIAMYPAYAGVVLILGKIIGALLFFPGTPLTLLAGATFGVLYGGIISLIGNIVGAILAFFVSRFFLQKYVHTKILSKYPKILEYEKRFASHGLETVILLRLIPLFPFNALNYLLGVTKVSNREYIVGTCIGIIPGTFAFVYFGNSLAMLSGVHIIISLVAIIGLIYIGKHYEKK
jgi:uncharacterized membrane protein YdjX (TVP38/TMEM64 family)